MIIADSSVVVAALLSHAPFGDWAGAAITADDVSAPHLLTFEVANVLRRHAAVGLVSLDIARLAHDDLVALHIDYWHYHELARRAWELRSNLTIYDASFVALAELLGADLYTLDGRLARVNGLHCRVVTPDS